MYYFKSNDGKLEKYLVTYDEAKIKELKQEIIMTCSYIEHNEHVSDYEPRFHDLTLIHNFHCECVGRKEYFEETRTVYKYSYDEYKPPRLVLLINLLLNQELSSVDEILEYDVSNDVLIEDRIDKANKELMELDVSEVSKRKMKLDEINRLVSEKELNKNQESIEPYYNRLLELINFTFIDSIKISDLGKVESFFNIELVDKSFVKTLKK